MYIMYECQKLKLQISTDLKESNLNGKKFIH